MPSEQRCSLEEYLQGEEEVPLCVDIDREDWEANFIAQLVDGDEDDMDAEEEPVAIKYKKFTEVIKELDEIKPFFFRRSWVC